MEYKTKEERKEGGRNLKEKKYFLKLNH